MTAEALENIPEEVEMEAAFLKEIETFYFSSEMPKVRRALSEFKTENKEFAAECRLRYLRERLVEIKNEIAGIYKKYKQLTKAGTGYVTKFIVVIRLDGLKRELKKVESEIRFLTCHKNGQLLKDAITEEMIERAKQYPFENLVEVKKGKALCPFHEDKNPSMDVRKGYFFCYACGEKGDIIAFVMKRDGMNFKEAVQWLNQ